MEGTKPQVDVIVGGMYGSEGKGKVAGYLGDEYDVAVRVGGPNAGHTLRIGGKIFKMQCLPVAGLVNPDIVLCIGAAGLINLNILKREMGYIKDIEGRFFIDRNAGIIEEHHAHQELAGKMFEHIGSTCEGVGAALADKMMRKGAIRIAKDVPELAPYILNISKFINDLPADKKVMIEGTQGYALSLNHGQYPYVTSRDIIASSLLSDVGLAPSLCKEIIMVIRTYPIRVAGNSGPMCGKELTWEEVTERSGSPDFLIEKTTVTKRVRRVCEFNMDLVIEAVKVNRPTQIALMFADYLDHKNKGATQWKELIDPTQDLIEDIERATEVPCTLIGTGIDFGNLIDRRRK